MLLCGVPLLDFAQDSLNRADHYCNYYNRQFDSANLCNDNPWILVFEDDFRGHGLDKSVWFDSLMDGAHLRPGREQQYYTFDGSNYEVANGKLYLITDTLDHPENKRVFERRPDELILGDGIQNLREFKYTSSNIETIKKFSNGRFEARVRLPCGKGFWPAFWLLNPGPRYNELDIFEFWNEENFWGNYDPDKLCRVHHMTSHFESVGQQCHQEQDYGIDFSSDYYTFGVDWDRNKILWYVRSGQNYYLGREKYKLKMNDICEVIPGLSYKTDLSQPEDPMCMILNIAIQGKNLQSNDSPDAYTPFPSKMRVDWVRVWYRMNMGDVAITAPTQCILDNELFNAVTGTNVTIDCDYVVPRGQQLSLSASETVILKSGFVAEAGSVFNARSKQPIYDDRSDKGETDDEDYTDELADYATDNQIERDAISTDGFHLSTKGSYSISHGLYVYPNPNKGVFQVQLPSSVSGKCLISITDINGHLVFATETDGAENFSIDISTLPKGIYLLHVVGFDFDYNNYQKIIQL